MFRIRHTDVFTFLANDDAQFDFVTDIGASLWNLNGYVSGQLYSVDTLQFKFEILTTISSPSVIYEVDGFKNKTGSSGFCTFGFSSMSLEKKKPESLGLNSRNDR